MKTIKIESNSIKDKVALISSEWPDNRKTEHILNVLEIKMKYFHRSYDVTVMRKYHFLYHYFFFFFANIGMCQH